jgi:hypothetical protein
MTHPFQPSLQTRSKVYLRGSALCQSLLNPFYQVGLRRFDAEALPFNTDS